MWVANFYLPAKAVGPAGLGLYVRSNTIMKHAESQEVDVLNLKATAYFCVFDLFMDLFCLYATLPNKSLRQLAVREQNNLQSKRTIQEEIAHKSRWSFYINKTNIKENPAK